MIFFLYSWHIFLYVILILSFFLYFSNCCSNLIIKQHKNVSKYQSCLKSSAKCLFFSLLHKGRKDTAAVKNIMMRFPDFFFFRLETGYPVGGFRLFCDRGFVAAWQQFFFNIFVLKLLFFQSFSSFFVVSFFFLLIVGLRATYIE